MAPSGAGQRPDKAQGPYWRDSSLINDKDMATTFMVMAEGTTGDVLEMPFLKYRMGP